MSQPGLSLVDGFPPRVLHAAGRSGASSLLRQLAIRKRSLPSSAGSTKPAAAAAAARLSSSSGLSSDRGGGGGGRQAAVRAGGRRRGRQAGRAGAGRRARCAPSLAPSPPSRAPRPPAASHWLARAGPAASCLTGPRATPGCLVRARARQPLQLPGLL